MTAYYNEIDPFAAAWLRELIKAGHIAPGEVDTRSIADVMPSDLAGFTQCHFFAGIGVWSYALRQAGWPDDRQVWTGSCPCQPFSSAGKGKGFKDERHLWPEFYRLISECRPATCFGEQVASKDGLAWLDLVQADMEGSNYAFGAVDTCAAGFGAPHIRQRLYWVGVDTLGNAALRGCVRGEMGNEAGPKCATSGSRKNEGSWGHDAADDGACVWVAHADSLRCEQASSAGLCSNTKFDAESCGTNGRPGPTNGHWRDADWLLCRDGKWRAVEPGTFPLAHGATHRMGCVCSQCKTEAVVYEGMYFLRKVSDWNEGREQKEVLQQRVLSFAQTINAFNKQEHCALSSKRAEGGLLRNVRKHRKVTCPPRGQESPERLSNEYTDTVLKVSPQEALKRTAICVRGMWEEIQGGVTPKPEQDMFCPVCQSLGPHIRTEEVVKNRVGRLRGYGNAINAEQAKAFIEAFMEVNR